MQRLLAGAVTALASAAVGFAQAPPDMLNRPGGARVLPQAVARPPRAYAEGTLVVAAGTWIQAFAGSQSAQKVILSDAAGLGCAWSFDPAPATGEGVAFSTPGAPGVYVFDDPTPTNPIYVACQAAGLLTVAST